MKDVINSINMEGLKFSGKVNASISHELKNVLAIISETAGFLNDLTDLAKQGKDLKISLLEGCSESIAEDIQRGFTTIKRMNQFAHSVDVPIEEIDLLETLELTVTLSGFLSFASKVQIKNCDEKIDPVLTCPFLLQNLLYHVLLFTYESVGPDGEILIEFNPRQTEGTHLSLSSPAKLILDDFPTAKIKKIAGILGLEFSVNASPAELDIWIPNESNAIVMLGKELETDSYI